MAYDMPEEVAILLSRTHGLAQQLYRLAREDVEARVWIEEEEC